MFDVCGNARQKREPHEIDGVELTHQAERKVARGAGMGGKCESHLAGFRHDCVLDEMFEGFGEQVTPLKQSQGQIFGERVDRTLSHYIWSRRFVEYGARLRWRCFGIG